MAIRYEDKPNVLQDDHRWRSIVSLLAGAHEEVALQADTAVRFFRQLTGRVVAPTTFPDQFRLNGLHRALPG